MIVLDTHAWVWWTGGLELLSTAARAAIEAADSVAVATISCWEVGRLATRGRMRLDRDVESWVAQALESVQGVPLTAEIALAAALLVEDGFPRDPADRIIYATAQELRCPLVTRDRRLRTFNPAGTIW